MRTSLRALHDQLSTHLIALALAASSIASLALAGAMGALLLPGSAYAATIETVYGVDRTEVVSWLESHENDDYYLGTPYKPYDWRSPNGDINKWGANSDGTSAGMNCTGFVWHVLCAAHGWKDDIATNLPALSGWKSAIDGGELVTYSFETKEDMLASGKLKKGDVIWMWDGGDANKVSDHHHVAIFWGDSSSEDKMWHSSGDSANNWKGENAISEIQGKAPSVSYEVVKLVEEGGISLKKVSSDPETTDDDDNFSLKGATYGVFSTKAKAKTHKADKAIRTYKTNAKGKFKTGMEYKPGTYYVAEVKASKGFQLDSSVYKVTVKANKTAKVNKGSVSEEPALGAISLQKQSSNALITDANRCYSLEGAVYGVFETYDDAATHDPSKAEHAYSTGADGAFTSEAELGAGTHYVSETAPPAGYVRDESVYTVEVAPGEVTAVGEAGCVSDAPKHNPVTLWAAKSDAETADRRAQGSATLEQARFEISYYDGYYEPATLPAVATRTWIVATDKEGKAPVRDDLKVGGDEFYRTPSGQVTIPLGTVAVREVQAPRGYLLGNGSDQTGGTRVVQIRSDANEEVVGVYTAIGVSDRVKRGSIKVGKIDRQHAEYLPQGAATLAGASFKVVTNNDQQVMVGGTRYAKGAVVATLETSLDGDGRYTASTAPDALPVGTYTVTEASSSEGYLFDDISKAWSKTVEITEDGQVVDLSGPGNAVANLVVRGDFGFSKVDGQTAARLGPVPFMVTSTSTGEQHVLVTDENGMLSTASSWNAHSKRTNANDEAVTQAEEGYAVDAGKLDPSAGVWFHGRTDSKCKVEDGLGALPYDTYDVAELRSEANAGFELAAFSVRISRNARELDLGTVDDNAGPLIQTTASDGSGVKLVPAAEAAVITDTVHYQNLDVKKTYTLKGSVHAVDESGEDAGTVAQASCEVKPRVTNGAADLDFELDTSELAGARLVVFEELEDDRGQVVADHRELDDEAQTVRVPAIKTTLADGSTASGDDEGGPREPENPDADGVEGAGDSDNEAAGPENESADSESAAAGVSPAPGEAGSDDGGTGSEDAPRPPESNSEGAQGADAADADDESREESAQRAADKPKADASGPITLIDTVAYEGLTPGVPYVLEGVLHLRNEDGSDGDEALDAQGKPISARQSFVAAHASGTVEVTFSFTAPDLAGKTTVAFEELMRRNQTYAVHADIADEGQSVSFNPPPPEPEPPAEPDVPEQAPTPEQPPAPAETPTPSPSLPAEQPPAQSPEAPTSLPESPAKQNPKRTAQTAKSPLPKTGDDLPLEAMALATASGIGLALAALCIRSMQRRREIAINRVPRRRR